MVGDPNQLLARLQAYREAGIEAFILSGYPHKVEADLFTRHVLPRQDQAVFCKPPKFARRVWATVATNDRADREASQHYLLQTRDIAHFRLRHPCGTMSLRPATFQVPGGQERESAHIWTDPQNERPRSRDWLTTLKGFEVMHAL